MPDTFSCALVLMGMESLLRALESGKNRSVGALRAGLDAWRAVQIACCHLTFSSAASRHGCDPQESTRVGCHRRCCDGHCLLVVRHPCTFSGGKGGNMVRHQGQSLSESLSSLWGHKGQLLGRFAFSALRTYAGFAAVLLGLWCLVCGGSGQEKTRWMVALYLGCALLMLRAGFYFHHHDYYIMPFVPAMALVAAVGLDRLPRRWAQVSLVMLVLEAGLNQQHDFGVPDPELPKLGLDQLAEITFQVTGMSSSSGKATP